ncbi:hypothetical protein ID852_13770 [Xenorhabdus sp. 42]|uniref:ATP-grasp domain-containing protein n=1 Tax=Xenorhabdus szentirmaii TaxID=290112 RepID=UPI000C055760|nr:MULTISPECIES: hypothetical protein [Xenorhabdus]MBD2780643.1 hypothetical protein [Xenorhabdus sp. 38]MBD2821745.1 hypothetical protein [Xenorhabdus sp. 42]PHM43157.1 ArgH2 [Xenorhabdus szentirmaii]
MFIEKYLLVLDYLPSRIHEIKLIKDYIQDKYNLDMVIISDFLSGEEGKLCDHVYHVPVSSPNYQDEVLKLIDSLEMKCVGILPFMDAVSGHAASLAKKLNVYGDDAVLSFAGINKLQFREQEKVLSRFLLAQDIVIPNLARINSYEQLSDFFGLCASGVVIKPVDGRANIGVKIVKDHELLKSSYEETLQTTPNSVIIAEELIEFDSEFSYDGVGSLHFLTQKVNQVGEYPVELGQIVPAQCPAINQLALMKAGQSMNLISGQRYGAFHNEIKLNSSTGETFLVETNRRPAGMHIWEMAAKVFNISLHKIWADHLIQGYSDTMTLPQANGSAFIINLVAPKDGVIKEGFDGVLLKEKTTSLVQELLYKYQYEILYTKIKITENSMVYKIPKTNNDFCGYVCVYINNAEVNHLELMQMINSSWQLLIQEFIV